LDGLASADRAEGDGEVPRYDARLAVAAHDRDEGVRKVRSLTVRGGIAGVAFSLLFGGVFAHHVDSAGSTTEHGQQQAQQHQSKTSGKTSSSKTSTKTSSKSKIVIPGQPPKPASGSGQVTSGAS
jgi:hypothetical protein